MRRLAPLAVILGLAFGVSRCALVSGLSDLDVAPDDAAVPVTDSSADASVDSSVDVVGDVALDAPVEATPPVTDAGCTCIPIPATWTPVRFRADRNASCPLGDSTEDVVLAPASVSASGPCDCTCTSQIDCANPVATYRAGQLCGGGGKATAPISTSGACTASPGNFGGTDSIDTTAKVASCTAQATAFPTIVTALGRLCTKSSSPCTNGTGCNDPAGGFASCIVGPGERQCPSDYPKVTLVAASVTDGRVCNGCGCNADQVKCQLTMNAFGTNACTASTSTMTTLLGTCANFQAEAFYKASVTVLGACAPTKGTATGAATAVQGRTVCCK